MSGTHGAPSPGHLFIFTDSPVHRLGATPKLAGLVAFVVLVALTPRTAVAALGVDLATVIIVVIVAKLPIIKVAARLGAIIPFVLFAVALPIIGTGERTDFAGLSWSIDGSWAAWGIISKAVIGTLSGIVVTATTRIPELLEGLTQLHVPKTIVAIIAVMIRYVDVVVDELNRTRRAMVARGHDARWLWQVRPIASSIGTLFVRSYERGERLHLAMIARGFDGTMPQRMRPPTDRATAKMWAMVPGVVAALGLAASLMAT